MRYPSFRNPEGFGDIFPILLGYIILFWISIETFDNIHTRRIYMLGAVIMLGWTSWAILSILEAGIEERDKQN